MSTNGIAALGHQAFAVPTDIEVDTNFATWLNAWFTFGGVVAAVLLAVLLALSDRRTARTLEAALGRIADLVAQGERRELRTDLYMERDPIRLRAFRSEISEHAPEFRPSLWSVYYLNPRSSLPTRQSKTDRSTIEATLDRIGERFDRHQIVARDVDRIVEFADLCLELELSPKPITDLIFEHKRDGDPIFQTELTRLMSPTGLYRCPDSKRWSMVSGFLDRLLASPRDSTSLEVLHVASDLVSLSSDDDDSNESLHRDVTTGFVMLLQRGCLGSLPQWADADSHVSPEEVAVVVLDACAHLVSVDSKTASHLTTRIMERICGVFEPFDEAFGEFDAGRLRSAMAEIDLRLPAYPLTDHRGQRVIDLLRSHVDRLAGGADAIVG